MAGFEQLEFFLLRYAGDITKGESINLGVVALAPESDNGGFADVRFIRNWRRLHCFDPLADVEELQAIERDIVRDLQDTQRRAELVRRIGDAWSNGVQMTSLQGCLTDLSPALELERLSAIYLDTPSITESRPLTGRQRILSVMREEFEKAGVLALLQKNVPIADYTKAGDPLRFDFGYALAHDLKFLHAVSLTQGTDRGKVLALQFPQIAAGVHAKRNAKAWLTAVVDDELDREREEVNYTLEMMQENGIAVTRAAEMPQIAEAIRIELQG
jgi:hypothetical protein